MATFKSYYLSVLSCLMAAKSEFTPSVFCKSIKLIKLLSSNMNLEGAASYYISRRDLEINRFSLCVGSVKSNVYIRGES